MKQEQQQDFRQKDLEFKKQELSLQKEKLDFEIAKFEAERTERQARLDLEVAERKAVIDVLKSKLM